MRKIIVAALLVCLVLVQSVSAYGLIETGREDASLTIDHVHSDVFFSIYRVADVSETVGFTLCGPFARYTDLQPLLDEGEWDDITEILDSRVARDEPEPEDTGETGRDGRLTFDRLEPGLFLVMSEPYRIGKTTYYLSTSLVCVPGLTSDDTWEYDTVINPKGSSEKDPEKPKTEISVHKIWRDAGFREERPNSITVELLRGNTVVDTVTLSARNNWRYRWSELPAGHRYRVVETDVPWGYADSYSREGDTVVIVNTYIPTQEPEKPQPPDKPQEPDINIPDEDVPLDKPTLPETGQLWWPVLLLTAAGLALILIGLIRRKGDSHEA